MIDRLLETAEVERRQKPDTSGVERQHRRHALLKEHSEQYQAVGGRGRHGMPPPLSSSPWAPKRLPPPSRRQRCSSFPRPTRSHDHRCSRLTRQHGCEQSGLVTLTFDLFDLESGVRVTCDVGYLCANFGLPRPLCSRLRPRQTDRRQRTSGRHTYVRQKHRLMPPPILGAGIITLSRVHTSANAQRSPLTVPSLPLSKIKLTGV